MATNTILVANSNNWTIIDSLSIKAATTPKPGWLMMRNSAGTVEGHDTQGGDAEGMLCMENEDAGKTATEAYTAGDLCKIVVPAPGSVVQVLVTAGEDIVIGDMLCSNGSAAPGQFEEVENEADTALCVAIEACDLSASGAVDTLCKVRWI